jgi:hypothetical protein
MPPDKELLDDIHRANDHGIATLARINYLEYIVATKLSQ